MANHICMWGPAKRGSWLTCSICDDRFPCAGNDCGHMDCVLEKKKMPNCHFCGRVVHGSTLYKPSGSISEGLQGLLAESGDWVMVNGRGVTFAAHACCRDAYASTPKADIVARFRAGYEPAQCSHEFENKQPMDLDLIKTLAQKDNE